MFRYTTLPALSWVTKAALHLNRHYCDRSSLLSQRMAHFLQQLQHSLLLNRNSSIPPLSNQGTRSLRVLPSQLSHLRIFTVHMCSRSILTLSTLEIISL